MKKINSIIAASFAALFALSSCQKSPCERNYGWLKININIADIGGSLAPGRTLKANSTFLVFYDGYNDLSKYQVASPNTGQEGFFFPGSYDKTISRI